MWCAVLAAWRPVRWAGAMGCRSPEGRDRYREAHRDRDRDRDRDPGARCVLCTSLASHLPATCWCHTEGHHVQVLVLGSICEASHTFARARARVRTHTHKHTHTSSSEGPVLMNSRTMARVWVGGGRYEGGGRDGGEGARRASQPVPPRVTVPAGTEEFQMDTSRCRHVHRYAMRMKEVGTRGSSLVSCCCCRDSALSGLCLKFHPRTSRSDMKMTNLLAVYCRGQHRRALRV